MHKFLRDLDTGDGEKLGLVGMLSLTETGICTAGCRSLMIAIRDLDRDRTSRVLERYRAPSMSCMIIIQ